MERLQQVFVYFLLVHMHLGSILTQNISRRNFVYSNNPYDTILEVIVNDTTEQIMDFYETTDSVGGFPTRVHVSTNDSVNGDHPVFITATQQKDKVLNSAYILLKELPVGLHSCSEGLRTHLWVNVSISSWEIPLVIRTGAATLRFPDMSRTLCPHDASASHGNNSMLLTRPTLHVSTSSAVNVTMRLQVKRVTQFNVVAGNESMVRVTPSSPHYYHFDFRDHPANAASHSLPAALHRFNYTIPKSVILIIESDDDICAVVSIQNDSCPVFDNEQDVRYQGYHLTMTRKGGITLTDSMFPEGFFIVFIVKESDEDCTGVSDTAAGIELDQGQVQARRSDGRVKNLRFRIIATISYKEYVVGALVTLALLTVIAMFSLAVYIPVCRCTEPIAVLISEAGTSAVPTSVNSEETLIAKDIARQDSHSDSEAEVSVSVPDMTVFGLSRARPAASTRRSNRYFWSALTVAVVYALPVVQLLSTYQRMVFQTGNQDLCYYNFLCAHPLGFLSDFNHVYSNIGYVVLGLVFMGQTRARQLSSRKQPEMGIPQHHGLLYSLGLALIMEGVLSACYHLCPNKMNFQFDSSFMYVISVISMVKLYQNRHPDVNASAHTTFMLLAFIMAVGLFGIMYPSVWFWSLFTAAHLLICFVLTLKIYYVGRFQFDSGMLSRAHNAVRTLGRHALVPDYGARAALLAIANVANLALAIYGLSKHNRDFARHLLAILMGNTVIYMLSYIVMKLVHREKIYVYTWLYLLLAHVAWFGALALFLDSRTKWSQTPANSRRHNAVCSALQFYDSHDLWHIASAAALYLSFNLVLTIDDGLIDVSRHDIPVF